MFRIVFLIVLFVFNVRGLYKYIRLQIDPSDELEALKELSNKEAKLTSSFLIIVIGIVYATILLLNSLIVPSYFLTIALIICAAIELCLIFPRIHRSTELYSGSLEEVTKKYLANLKSFYSVIGFIWNIAETGIIGATIYLILKELA
ncbi:hypothetical protein [Limosilactobacillus reuteri]|uniref:hypothetical protein n=1 Tax=Limosilactobacillus reuteri TaxID=1598 RepID=UPI003D96D691